MKKYYLLKMKEYEMRIEMFKTLLQYAIQEKQTILAQSYGMWLKDSADSWAEYNEKLNNLLARGEE